MSTERTLPKKRNPLLSPEHTPEHSELASRRRPGQTILKASGGSVGTSNALAPENLGLFEYVHIKLPLPDNLKGAHLFSPTPLTPHAEAYFLMRRSSDGYISASQMFRASFPWATEAEEQAERAHLYSLKSRSKKETAGSIWVPESVALELAEEYAIVPWVVALLDPSPVHSDEKKEITLPPKYKFTANQKSLFLPPPSSTPLRSRGRPRAASPVKGTPAKSPRKRQTKAMREANVVAAQQASDTLQAALDSTASVAGSESVEPPSVDEEKVLDGPNGISGAVDENDKVTVNVDSAVEVNGDIETTHTTVQVKMPLGSPELPLPETTEQMIETAKEMVEEARKLEGESSKAAGKRKLEVLELDNDDNDEGGSDSLAAGPNPAKKAKVMEQEIKKQKVRNRTLIGVAATVAIGVIIPYVIGG